MSIAIQITPNEAESKAIRTAFERCARVGRNMRPALTLIGLERKRASARKLRARKHDWGPLTGRLDKSLTMLVERASVTIGTNVVYAAVQQVGGDITPKTAKYLAIPVLASLRRSGVWPRDLPRDSMRWVPNAEIRIGTHAWTGPALVRAEPTVADAGPGKKKKGRAGEVMFALVRQVHVKGEPYLVWDAEAQRFALNQFENEYRRAMGLGGGA